MRGTLGSLQKRSPTTKSRRNVGRLRRAASAEIDAINKKIAAMRAPVERVQKAVAKFADVTGLNALGKGFGEIGRRSLDAFRSVSRIVEPLAAITSALSVAGMARLAFAWGEFGEKLSIAAQRIGISTGRLQSLQGGARLAGASAEAMTSGLRTLGDTLTDAVAGRAPEAVVMMNTLGIAWRDATGHARSVTDVLPELADRIAAIKNPALQARVATALLGAAGEQLLPYLRRGRQGMAEYVEEARHYGVITERAAEVAEEFARQQHALGLATEGLTNAIGEALAPALGPLWLGREDHLPPPQPAFDPNAPNGVPCTGPVFGPQTPRADVTMDPTKRGFLATLAGPESGGAYDIRNGGARFSDYSHFPEGTGPGGTCMAAGAYQFTAETWKEEAARLGLRDMTPANQDKAAWAWPSGATVPRPAAISKRTSTPGTAGPDRRGARPDLAVTAGRLAIPPDAGSVQCRAGAQHRRGCC